jgi:galactan 5-O-arabinofuranosyltransferase
MLIDSHPGLAMRADHPAETELYPLPDRKRLLSFGGEVVASIIVASAVSVLVQLIVNRLPIPRQSNVPTAITWSVVFVLSCVTIALLWKRWSRRSTIAAWILPAALTSTVQALVLFGTSLYLNGTNGDQFFRMQYFQRLTVSPSLSDGNYAGLPPYYPAGWFWLGGRFANLIGNPAWAAYKPFAILTIAVTSSLAFVFWSLVVSRRRALAVTTVFALAGTILGPYEPYSWVAMAFIPPIAVLAWRLFRSIAVQRDVTGLGPATVVIGVVISISAATYTLVFGFAVLLVVVLAISAGRGAVLSLARPLIVRLILIGLAAAPLTLLVWGAYLYAAIRLPSAGNAAAQFFPLGMATLGTPMLQPSVTGAICMLGLVWIIFAWRRSTVAQALGITVLVCVAWQLLSTLALADDTTLLSSHIAKVGEIVLWCACAFGLTDLATLVPQRFNVDNQRSMRVLVSVLAVLVTVALTQITPPSVQGLLNGAFASPDPHNTQLIDAIAQMSGRRPQDNILLTNDYQLLDYQPYHSFQTNKEQYANPLALYPERNQELTHWSQSGTSAAFWSDLMSSKFRTPDVFVFSRDAAGNYPYDLVTTDFPLDNKTQVITFPAKLFESAHFISREVGPFTVIVLSR